MKNLEISLFHVNFVCLSGSFLCDIGAISIYFQLIVQVKILGLNIESHACSCFEVHVSQDEDVLLIIITGTYILN